MPLVRINLDFNRQRDTALLRSFKTLETINDRPAADFWKEVDTPCVTCGLPWGRFSNLPVLVVDVASCRVCS